MHIDPKEGHPAMDYVEHEKSYKMFLRGTIYILISVIAIMVFLALFVV